MISQTALANALKMTKQNVSKLKKQGMPVDSVESAQAWRVARQNVAARKPAPPVTALRMTVPSVNPFTQQDHVGTDLDMGEGHDAARTRLRISEANLSEMKEAEENGTLIRIDAVKAVLSVAMATAREALLQIPSRLAPLLAADSDPASVQNVLYGEIHHALQQVSSASDQLGKPSGELA